MAYDEQFAERVREIVREEAGYDEKKMFGGIAFMIEGNMAVGILEDGLMVRMDPADYEGALLEPGVRPFDMTGKRMKGWVAVDESVLDEADELSRWVATGVDFARTFPPK